MLVRYKKSLEKIAMGLLSFMPQQKDVKKLMETMQSYEQEDNWQLYLWKNNDEYVGIVGVVVEDSVATVQHITVVPSYRGEGIAKKMLKELIDSGKFTEIKACEETEPFVNKCLYSIKEADGN
ncbi:MAG: GNAT family N-acetyltransferase [Bacilli bacterium]|jgi:riboflavin biosynthesis RibT protein|uniref:GNAT family N-acetyltransferase n=1 Tax=Ureibacillus sp. FSL W7-1570 TaxID=2954593 RepID=UPI001EB88AAD|nr:GNAT family N-acetyltransferase [Bacilli bacterium]